MTLEELIDLLFRPLLLLRQRREWRRPEEAAREHAHWLTLNVHWVEDHYAEMAGHRGEPDDEFIDRPIGATRGPQRLVEGKTSTDEPITYLGPGFPNLRKMEEGERPVEYLYRKASMHDRAAAEEFATAQRLKKIAALKRRVFLQRLDQKMQDHVQGKNALEARVEPVAPQTPPVNPGLQPLNWGWDEAAPASESGTWISSRRSS